MWRILPTLLLVCVLAVTVVSVPASAANREHQQMMADIRILQEQTQQLQVAIASLTEALGTITARLDEQSGVSRKQFADQKLLVDGVANDIRVVREKIDDNNVRIGNLSLDIEALRQAIPPQGAAPAAPVEPVPGAEVPPAAGAPPPAAAPGGPIVTDPKRQWQAALADYGAGQHDLSINGFEALIRSFPKTEIASEAQYWIGKNHAQMGKYREALGAYEKAIADYPNARILPDVYFERGNAFNALGQPDRARESWEFAARTYPNTDAGRLARQRLDQPIKK